MTYTPASTIRQMVYNRLGYLPATTNNDTLVDAFIYEVLWDLEPCFKASAATDPASDDNVGNETYYNYQQKSVAADLAAWQILLIEGGKIAGQATSGSSGTPLGVYLKRAKAGASEAEFGAFDKDSAAGNAMSMSLKDLLAHYKASAVRRAALMGCYFDLCDDCTITFTQFVPSVVVGSGCTSCGA